MVFIIYKLEYDNSSIHEAEAGFSYSLNDACDKTYQMIINDNTPTESIRMKYYIREYNEPVKPISCPVAVYTFDAHHNCINNKQIVWSP